MPSLLIPLRCWYLNVSAFPPASRNRCLRCAAPMIAEMLRLDRLAVLAHRCEQLGDAAAVDLIDAEELS